jgi:CTP:molybdopterin cytidylyltransferase MocA
MPAGLILAAGAGARFGHAPKQLALLAGRPLLQWAVDAQCDVPVEILDPIVVILGAHAAQIRATVDFRRAVPVHCPQWATGQAASLRCGLEDLGARSARSARNAGSAGSARSAQNAGSAGSARSAQNAGSAGRAAETVVVTLGDAPLIPSAVIAHFAGEPGGTRAIFNGQPGHPVVLGAREITALTDYTGDRGARDVLRDARTVEIGHLCVGRDVDTPADLEEIRAEARSLTER